ncbi:MAG: S-adenosyl-l-methionine hydroxide adenosyltransferase family protein [Candidatus Hodarchaeota archaeon]
MAEPNCNVIGLLTDFGLKSSHYISSMKGVILKINPIAKIIDVSHNISSFSIIEASYIIKTTYKHFPRYTVFIIVVDPGVGSYREILALKSDSNYYFVGPNNGIFSDLLENDNISECVKLQNEDFFLHPLSNTFHGRDIMAPVGAYISKGTQLKNFGPKFSLNNLVEFPLKYEVLLKKKEILCTIQYIDSFGNITTNIKIDHNNTIKGTPFSIKFDDIIAVQIKNQSFKGKYTSHFSHVPINALLFLRGSSGYLEISINQGSAAKELKVKVEDIIKVNL